ncbi:protein gamma response 1 [Andrographis paniculata]|uniref:protein gamma response 1 n=1 Tax=Andrographis paniculata TaxID=175694 RepID=UPI0021E7762B|nr:protein gamma response 1 [Andrographis paniculata]XP_051131857.1 protein gamma response 1 [Andrographis paniculata]XP_051131941.1 protein gamma response 1 [Andrographis paniculata]XP_051132008.1 protein gamma response 1 [Andrographis paniculata]
MSSSLMTSPNLGHADSVDAKTISKLSTLLVASIQDAKDRISQIEFIFCKQLYPKVHYNCQSFQKIYSEAKVASEKAYEEKEKDLLLQIKKLQCENQHMLNENQLLKSEKATSISNEKQLCSRLEEFQQDLKQKNTEIIEVKGVHKNLQKEIKELQEKNCMLENMLKKLEFETGELQLELNKKSEEVDFEKELKIKCLQAHELNVSLMTQKDLQLKEYKEQTNGLISKLQSTENQVNGLLQLLKNKSEEVCKGKELHEDLLKRIELQASEMMSSKQVSDRYEKENKLLVAKIETLMSLVDELERELGNEPVELQERRKVPLQLIKQIHSSHSERIKREPGLDELEEERKQLLDKQTNLQDKVDELQCCLFERMKQSSLQIAAKDSELQNEKSKNRYIVASYKNLKSQYCFLLKKSNLTEENMLSAPIDKMEDESKRNIFSETPLISLEAENNGSRALRIPGDVTKQMDVEAETPDVKRGVISIKNSSPISPSTSIPPNSPTNTKPCSTSGAKRPLSYWRDTRSHQSRLGPDPHDDFLDTPLENMRKNLGKIMEDLQEPAPENMIHGNSDDETQDMKADAGPPKLCSPPPKAGTSGFKYVEPVRKKAERDNLKGVECNQCKKFYDAVLDDAAAGSDKKNIRCEHHDGVSRHRYRYAPPMTPEGFWNIGFESEME